MPFFSGSFYEISNKAEVVMHQSDLILERSALLYERYAPMVFAYLLRRLDARDGRHAGGNRAPAGGLASGFYRPSTSRIE